MNLVKSRRRFFGVLATIVMAPFAFKDADGKVNPRAFTKTLKQKKERVVEDLERYFDSVLNPPRKTIIVDLTQNGENVIDEWENKQVDDIDCIHKKEGI